MKTKLFIAVIMITAVSFAQSKRDQISNPNQSNAAIYVKFDEVKGETNENSSKRTIKIGGAEKPYARTKAEPGQNSNRWWVNKKMRQSQMDSQELAEVENGISETLGIQQITGLVVEGAITNTNTRRRADVTMKDVTLDKQQKSNKRRRVVVAKSNKQGDPDANKK